MTRSTRHPSRLAGAGVSGARTGTARAPGRVRIVGGKWKRTPLPVPAVEGLRPTPDRVRETLFNWLGQDLRGRACLDLFAGTGALGLEAASRGGSPVWLVEADPRAAAALRDTLRRLSPADVELHACDALAALAAATARGSRFDVVFLDPPFRMGWPERVLPLLAAVLAPAASIYLEAERELDPGELDRLLGRPCERLRFGRAGQVFYHLVRCG